VLLQAIGGRGKASGLELGRVKGGKGAALSHVRGGQVTKHVVHFDRERAFADLRLGSEGASPGS